MNLRHLVTIQSFAPTQDSGTGEMTDAWTTFATVYADIKPASVREFVAADAKAAKVTSIILIRYLPGVLPSMRIIYGSKTFNIEGVLPDSRSGLEYLTLPVSEIVKG